MLDTCKSHLLPFILTQLPHVSTRITMYLFSSFADNTAMAEPTDALFFLPQTTNCLNTETSLTHTKSASAGRNQDYNSSLHSPIRCQNEQSCPGHARAVWPAEFISFCCGMDSFIRINLAHLTRNWPPHSSTKKEKHMAQTVVGLTHHAYKWNMKGEG